MAKTKNEETREEFPVKHIRVVRMDTGRQPWPITEHLEIITERDGKEQLWIPVNSEGHPVALSLRGEQPVTDPPEESLEELPSSTLEETK